MVVSVSKVGKAESSSALAGAGRGRPSTERSVEITTRIVRCAAEIFLSDGYETTSMEAVARAVGVPKSTLYKRFSDKNALLRAVVDDFMQQWAKRRSAASNRQPADLAGALVQQLTVVLVGATHPQVRAINRLAMNLPESLGHELSGRSFWGYRNVRDMLVGTITRLGPAEGVHAAEPERVAETLLDLAAGWLVTNGTARQLKHDAASATARWFVDFAIRGADAW